MGICISKAWDGICTLFKIKRKTNNDDSLLFPFVSPSTISNLRFQSEAHLQPPQSEVQCDGLVKIVDASSIFYSVLSQAFRQMQTCPHCRREVIDAPSIECTQQRMLLTFKSLLFQRHNESNQESVINLMHRVATVRRSCHQRSILAFPSNASDEEEYDDKSLSPTSSEVEFLWTAPCDNGLFPENSITVFHSHENLFAREEEEEESNVRASASSDDYSKKYVTYLENLTFSYANDKLPLCLTVSSTDNFA